MLTSAGIVTQDITIIDDYEDQNLTEYTGDTGNYAFVTSPVVNGTYALEQTGGLSEVRSTSGSGLANYFAKGTEAWIYLRSANVDAGAARSTYLFGVNASTPTNDRYRARLEWANDRLELLTEVSGSPTLIGSEDFGTALADNTWYLLQVTWDDGTLGGSNNDITLELWTVSGASPDTQLGTGFTTNNSDHAANEGVGLRSDGTTTNPVYFDFNHIPNP